MDASSYKDLPIGYELEPVKKALTPEISKEFSWWPILKDFHTDEGIARSFGFPNLLAQGALVACYLSQLCLKFFGEWWLTHGELKVEFKKTVFVPQYITARGKLTERIEETGGGIKFAFEVWVENEAGEKVQTGSASCIIR